jgi:nucleoside-diphosphate-sugar epimerase
VLDLSLFERVAITGGTGFIGGHLTRALVGMGCRPVLLARAVKRDGQFADLHDRVRWMRVDLEEPRALWNAVREFRPKTVIHLAGVLGRGDAGAASVACAEMNVAATVRLLDAAMRAGAQRVVILGSAEEYGDQQGPLHEELPVFPVSPYGIAKAAASNFAKALHAKVGCPVVVARPFSAYGPGQPAGMFVAQAVDAALRNLPFRMSHGEQRRDLVFVGDVASGLIAAAGAPRVEGRVINLGSGRPHRLRDVAEMIWRLAGATAPLLIGARAASMEQLHDTWADTALARRLLGWESRVELETGLRQTIQWARAEFAREQVKCQLA